MAISNMNLTPETDDLRQFQRVSAIVSGRYMLQDKQDYPCTTNDISPGDLVLSGPVKGAVGERVVAYLDHLGRIEGQILRHTDTGFAMSLSATVRKRDKLAAQLTWLANRKALGLPEDRRHERVVPKNPRTRLLFDDGVEQMVRLIDVSLSGAAVAIDIRPAIGTPVKIGKVRARVVRYIENGFALEFSYPLNEDAIDEQLSV